MGKRGVTSGSSILRESHALGDPTRYAVFEALRAARVPLSISDLEAQIPVHHNAIRAHVKVLMDAGLVVRVSIRGLAQQSADPAEGEGNGRRGVPDHGPSSDPGPGRGRPAHRFALSTEATARWSSTDTHEELSIMLLDLIASGDTPRVVGQRAGRRLSEAVLGEHEGEATTLTALLAVTTELGFDPVPEAGGMRLRTCPYAATASRSRDIVCALHLGIGEGVAGRVAGPHHLRQHVDLEMHDPYAGRCRFIVPSL